MKRLAVVLLPLAALVAGMLGPVSAAASEPLNLEWRLWPALPCATGAMTAESLPGRVVWATGWIGPCDGTPVPADSRYAIVYFDSAGGVAGRPLHYADRVAATEFAGQLETTLPGASDLAACLAYSPTGLLSCVSIDVGDEPDRLVVKPIPTDHPRVTLPVSPLMRSDDNHAYCGTCL